MKFFGWALVSGSVFLVSCSSKQLTTSAEAEKKIDDKYKALIGSGTKSDLIQDFGNPDWCHEESAGGETCRFFYQTGTRWVGEGTNKKSYSTFDEVMAEFDTNGFLRTFKVKSQR